MLVLRGALKDYAWGRVDGLAAWTAPTGAPQAELWFGAHPSGPSPLVDADGAPTGEVCALTDAPVLVKLLAAGQPLSVQVHPSRVIAEEQWAKQLEGAPQVYADPNEKAEVLYALETFRTFAGWRDLEDAATVFDAIPGAEDVSRALRAGDRLAAVRTILHLDDLPAKVAAVPLAVRTLDTKAQQAYQQVATQYPDDVGVLITVLLDTITLAPGEAMFVAAGVPHSYIDGLGVEVMTASDNVARLGLTTKPVFPDHALRALRADLAPLRLRGDVLQTPAGFDLAIVRAGERALPSGRYRLVLALEPEVWVDGNALAVGAAAVCTADEPDMRIRASGVAALITAPPQ